MNKKLKKKPVMAEIGEFTQEKFWVVARNTNRLESTMRHSTEESAYTEAARLASISGGTFLVMACVGAITRKEVTQKATMTEPRVDAVPQEEDMPF
jgi:hypothetical protein